MHVEAPLGSDRGQHCWPHMWWIRRSQIARPRRISAIGFRTYRHPGKIIRIAILGLEYFLHEKALFNICTWLKTEKLFLIFFLFNNEKYHVNSFDIISSMRYILAKKSSCTYFILIENSVSVLIKQTLWIASNKKWYKVTHTSTFGKKYCLPI